MYFIGDKTLRNLIQTVGKKKNTPVFINVDLM